MQSLSIPISRARQIAIKCQLLNRNASLDIDTVIKHLSYVQIDTIHVIERAHHHTLWTRCPNYTSDGLDGLLSDKRTVFEFWTHAAAYLPMEDYRFYLPKMERFNDPHSKWEKERLRNFGHLMEPVLERIRKEGPLGVKDFEAPVNGDKNRWGGRKPEKVALEMLLWQEKLMVTRRDKFHRIYDLTERVLPASIDTSLPTDEESGKFQVLSTLQSYGLATEKEINYNLQLVGKTEISSTIRALIEAGEIVKVTVGGLKDTYWCRPDVLNIPEYAESEKEVSFLSPFDNLIIQRDRVKRLFDFDYTLECYVPAAKRKWGYFVTPILWSDRLIGRFDPKADRKKKELMINSLQFEPWFDEHDKIIEPLALRLVGFAGFNQCEKIKIIKSDNPRFKKRLAEVLKAVI